MPSILGANTLSSGYDVANSLRFNDDDSAYLNKTPSGDGSRVKWTWSGWVKRCSFGHQPIFSTPGNDSNIYDEFYFNDADKIQYSAVVSGTQYALRTARRFRDTNAWYHIVLIVDSNNGTAGDRMQLWINGVRTAEGDMEDTTFKDAQNYSTATNKADYVTYIGRVSTNTAAYFDGYMAEIVFQNDNADSPVDKFGEFDSDSPTLWKAKDVSGSATGTNAFYLDFEDSSSLGNDAAGSNNWSSNNLAATDQSTDTPTNNFMTLNPLASDSGVTLSEGNVESDYDASVGNAKGSIGLTAGRWYWEVKIINAASYYPMIGIGSMEQPAMQKPTGGSYPGGFTDSYGVYGNSLRHYANGVNEGNQGDNYGTGDIFGIYLDLESGTKTIKWYKNGSEVLSDDITNAGDDYPYTCMDYNGGEGAVNVGYNFGGTPGFAISSGNSDDNGYGNFEYSPNISSTKYYAVCTKNLAEFG